MKSVIALSIAFFSVIGNASELPVFPDCYRGTMSASNGKKVDVFVSFSSVENKLARVQALQIGNYSHKTSGTVVSENTVTLNSNDDYIPGGNATYNIDIKMQFNGKTAIGTFNEYRFQDGRGGYAQSDAKSLVSSGTMQLKKCLVKVVDQ